MIEQPIGQLDEETFGPDSYNGCCYVYNNPINMADPSGLISEADLMQAVTDLKACGAGNDLFNKAVEALKKEPKGKNITVTTKPVDNLPPDASNVMTGSIRIDGSTSRCTSLETLLVELNHIANRGTFIKVIQDACTMTRANYIRAIEENEFNSVQSATKTWKACTKGWKCPDKCPNYGDPDDRIKEKFEDHFKKLSSQHKEDIGKRWDDQCK